MVDEANDATDDAGIPPVGEKSETKSRRPFSRLAFELDKPDLESPGVQKLLLAEISRLEGEVFRLENLRSKFHEADKKCAVLEEAGKTHRFSEILYSVSLTLGAALIGLTPSIESTHYGPEVVLLIGIVLVGGAVLAKVRRK